MARTVPFVPREYHLAKNSKELLVATMDTLRAISDYRDAGVLHGHITTMSIMHVDLPEDAPARYDGIRTRGILLDLDDSDEFVIPDKQPMPKQEESSTQPAVANEKLPILPVD